MEKDIKGLLNEEIKMELSALEGLTPGSDEHAEAVDTLVKLYKLKIEESKLENEFEEKRERRSMDENDLMFKEIQAGEQKIDRYLKLAVEMAGIVLPLIFYAVWMCKGFEFEKKGTFTSTTFRGLFNRFKPTK